jgi:hypothetical protein
MKQSLIAFVLVLFAPIFLMLSLLGLALLAACTTIAGFVCGPMIFSNHSVQASRWSIILKFPFLLLVGAMVGFVGGAGYGIKVLVTKAIFYWRVISTALGFQLRKEDIFDDEL